MICLLHLSDLDLRNGSIDEMLERFDTSILKMLDFWILMHLLNSASAT